MMEANKAYEAAKLDKLKHEEHFQHFPAMKDRYGGAFTRAEEDLSKATEEWNAKGYQIDTYFNTVLRLIRDQRDQEEVARKVAEKVVQERTASTTGVAELRDEMQALRDENRKRSTEVTELNTFCTTAMGKLEVKQAFLNTEVETMKSGMQSLKEDVLDLRKEVLDAQQLAVMASDAMQGLRGLTARVEKVW
jgi:chromosome segregation ATPase